MNHRELTFSYFAAKSDLEKVEYICTNRSRTRDDTLQVASQDSLDLPETFKQNLTNVQHCRTFLNTNLSQKGCVTTPVACKLASFVRTACRNIAPFRPGTFPAVIAAWYMRFKTRGTDGKKFGLRICASSSSRRGSPLKKPMAPPRAMTASWLPRCDRFL
jgi:hypothetical protein